MKVLLLHFCKALGLFHLALRLTEKQARILCYHGISLEDEHRFRPGLFMRAETFAARMALVKRWGFQAVSLDELHSQLHGNEVSPGTLVITIDDGWAGIEVGMLPSLRAHGFPATLYLSTYFVESRRPVFKVAVYYLFWKYGTAFPVSPSSCLHGITVEEALDADDVIVAASALGSSCEQPILEELCGYFGESVEAWKASGKFMFLSPVQVAALAAQGIMMELHTHRHRFAEIDLEAAQNEVELNRASVHAMTGTSPSHFCYPRGEYTFDQVAMLDRLDVLTATTTRNELVCKGASRLELPRIMDSEHITAIEFEAELTGFMSVLRRLVHFPLWREA